MAVVGVVLGVRNLSQQGLFLIGGSASDRLGARRVIIAGCGLRAAVQYVFQDARASFDHHRGVLDQVSRTAVRLRGLSPAQARAGVLDQLAELRRRHDLTLLLISHDLDVVARIADHVVVLDQGRVVEQGPAATVLPTTPK